MKIQSIQFLRAVAAMLVVYAHCIDMQMKYAVSVQQHLLALQNFGAIGVDIFFVVSGFIITYTAGNYDRPDAGRFIVKRFIRINPVYYVATLLYFLPNLIHHFRTGQPLYITTSLIVDSIFILPVAPHSGFGVPYLVIGWTLAFEWLFYLIFLLLILFRLRNREIWMVILAGILILSRLRFISNPILLEFVLGVLLCGVYRRFGIGKAMAFGCTMLAGCILIFEVICGFGRISESGYTLDGSLSWQRVGLWGIPSALLVIGCIGLERNGIGKGLWKNRPAALTGDASYSIYLTHLIVLLLLDSIFLRYGFPRSPDLTIWAMVVLALLAGILFYILVEAPLLKRLRPNDPPQPPQPPQPTQPQHAP